MDEFLSSVNFNRNGDLIISSSYYTYQHWIGFIGFISNNDLTHSLDNTRPLMLSSLKTGKSLDSGVCSANWTGDKSFFVGTDNGEVMLYKLTDQPDSLYQNLMTKKEHDGLVLCLATCYDSNLALSGGEDARIKLWSLNDELSMNTFKGHDYAVCSLSLNPNNNQTFVSCSEDNQALLWDTRKESPALIIHHQMNGYPSASDWSTYDPNLISLGSETGQFGVYDIRTLGQQKPYAFLKTNNRLIRKIKFSPSTNLVAVASEDCTTEVFSLTSSSVLNDSGVAKIYSNREHFDYVTGLAWNPMSQNALFSCSWDGLIKTHQINYNNKCSDF